jgi:hypothetical protein
MGAHPLKFKCMNAKQQPWRQAGIDAAVSVLCGTKTKCAAKRWRLVEAVPLAGLGSPDVLYWCDGGCCGTRLRSGYAELQAASQEQYAAAHDMQALTAQEEKQWLMQCHSACHIAHIKASAAAQRAAELPLQQQVAAMEGEPFHGCNPDQSLVQGFPETEAGGVGLAAGLGHEPPLMAVMPPPLSREPCRECFCSSSSWGIHACQFFITSLHC